MIASVRIKLDDKCPEKCRFWFVVGKLAYDGTNVFEIVKVKENG